MKGCIAQSKAGGPCGSPAQRDSEYCWFHDPAKAKERAAAQLKGGERRVELAGGRAAIRKALGRKSLDEAELGEVKFETPADVRDLLARTTKAVLTGRVSPELANAVTSMANVALRAMKEGDTDERLKKLEDQTRVLKDVPTEALVEIVRTARAVRAGAAVEH